MQTLNKTKNFLSLEERYSNFDESLIVIVPIPYEQTTSYGKGTKFAPEAILRASAFVEFFDEEFEKELCFDKGIATLSPLQFSDNEIHKSLDIIYKTTQQLLEYGKFIASIGGEHTISFPIIKAFKSYYNDFSILHFDAHSDLRQTYDGTSFSHACVIARILEIFSNPQNIVQVGIRAQSIEENQLIKTMGIKTFFSNKIRTGYYGNNWQETIVKCLKDYIYVTFDVDFFDPMVIPATGTPEPDGFMYHETLEIFREIRRQGKKIIGFDVVELSPIPNLHHCELTVARLIYKILNFVFY